MHLQIVTCTFTASLLLNWQLPESCFWFLKSVPLLMLHSHPSSAFIIMDIRSAIIRHSALMTCCTPIMPSPYTSVRWMRYFMGGKHFSPINTELPFMGPSFQCWCHCTSTYPINSIWQTDSCAICCMLPVLQLLHTSSVVLQPNSGLHSLNCACLRILNERFVLWCWHDNPHTSTPILSDVRVPVSSSAALA